MIFGNITKQSSLRDAITSAYRMDETTCIDSLLKEAIISPEIKQRITMTATQLALGIQKNRKKRGALDAFLHEYDLSSEEGIALMCLAEALLRIPDTYTTDRLISDKISTASWEKHLKNSDSVLVNAATWSLLLTGKILKPALDTHKTLTATLKRLFSRTSSTVIRPIILQAMKAIGKQFVMGRTISEALERAKEAESRGYCYSYDMLGEAAHTQEDADNYFKSYQEAIIQIGQSSVNSNPANNPGISIKLSALHPRYGFAKRERVINELTPRLLSLVKAAKKQNIGLTVDAEEADRLELSLDIIEAIFSDPDLKGWEGFGLAVQAYQKRAPFVINWLADLSKRYQRRLNVRLIKGAYWDTEIKQSQLLGLKNYPVFTRKNSTDVSFIACAKKLLAHPEYFYPQFGTHNAYSAAVILELRQHYPTIPFEFQCLHGMGESLYDQIVGKDHFDIPCRIYAPVGSHQDLLGYLVRRLLENGANTSFINLVANENIPIEKIIADPVERIANLSEKPHPSIPLPKGIYGKERQNSAGIDLSDMHTLTHLKSEIDHASKKKWESSPKIAGKSVTHSPAQTILSPNNTNQSIGFVRESTADDVNNALTKASQYSRAWANVPIEERSQCLERAADLFEKNCASLIFLLCKEGGKQLVDCIGEIRETVDFCRYYAQRARKDLNPQILPGPTGEFNQLSLHPRGIFVCISPWNFPLAIFTGQIVAALVTGNLVIAKPAEQTPLIAAEAVRLLHEAGIPGSVLQLLPGRGEIIGAHLVSDPRVAGVMFTGSTETAKLIQQTLANRTGPIVPLIAETGGQNAMIVDSSALPEQVVADVLSSAFNSAGQRCSALRVLFIQEDAAPRLLNMLTGAMAELSIGDPSLLSTDIGPVIDQNALNMLRNHFMKMQKEAKLLYQVPMRSANEGYFFAPCAFELNDLSILQREIFGPILHVIRYPAKELDKVLDAILNTGYGLTLGIHSRIDSTASYITNRVAVGNVYVNRNMIGAVVGTQPFGGERLSGTGPKAGGPYYLPRLCVERALSINTTAAGGNATLVSLHEDD
jgi:RHH-type proline utilization regulon transcriptional repressor/proline dehydrogenase/delta 1-pyrroline-5-carboxylate dehydrogenase